MATILNQKGWYYVDCSIYTLLDPRFKKHGFFDARKLNIAIGYINQTRYKSTTNINFFEIPIPNVSSEIWRVNENPLLWWSERKYIYPQLYEIVKSLLCLIATPVSCKHIFSKAGQVNYHFSEEYPDIPSYTVFIIYMNG
ncbi:zinc finger BED domain-containing protein 1-like [Aphis craccivora]|uniref:Zinc finger BED domain-containing protein 1-like n=1 Tax=Aphis craccivora TaxID=307492 RepID=A0A6G0YU95_APHCR|nr:zinc finger BED domain-containing protein 1-like [Aphis craccivora]